MKQRVLVASNRGPVSHEFGADGAVTARRGSGGLVAGVGAGWTGVVVGAVPGVDGAVAGVDGTAVVTVRAPA